MRKLNGKIALVTGASSGIGMATALVLAAQGAVVAIAARRRQRLDDLAKRIRDAGGEVLVIEADISDEAQATTMVGRVLESYGRLDMLFNVAGVGVAAPFQNTTTSEYRAMVDINILGLLYTINAALPAMKRQCSGHIVIVSSHRPLHPPFGRLFWHQACGQRHGGIAAPRNRQGWHPRHRDRAGRSQDRVHRQHAR
jgi:NADP-dependent 3-hydroxy acid dehydrogenase YdfG